MEEENSGPLEVGQYSRYPDDIHIGDIDIDILNCSALLVYSHI